MNYQEIVQNNPQLNSLLLPKWSRYIPHHPEPKQMAFLWLDDLEAFYGGAAGGMKSDTLLMAALQYVDVPGYSAVLFRDTYANLNKAEGLLDRAHEWLSPTDARWDGDAKRYVFPSGAKLAFSYLDGPRDHFNHQGPAYQFVGMDEIVNIRENQAMYLFSRMRKRTPESYKSDLQKLTSFTDEEIEQFYHQYMNIPLRFRAASNPPAQEQMSIGAWVKRRYVDEETRQGVFIPASLFDNPHVDHESYIKSLDKLDPVTRAQLLRGDWNIRTSGRMFDRSWFPIVDQAPNTTGVRRVRFYDPAHTEPKKKNIGKGSTDPDYFCGCKMSMTTTGLVFIEHMSRWRKTPLKSKESVKNQASTDTKSTEIFIEREPSAGTTLIDDYVRLLAGWSVRGRTPPKGHKLERSQALASYAENGNVYLVNGPWINDFLDELELFPDGEHDDQITAAGGAFNELTGKGRDVNLRWV